MPKELPPYGNYDWARKRQFREQLESLNLSTRAINALLNTDMHSVDEARKCSNKKLKSYHGFGKKTLEEVRHKIPYNDLPNEVHLWARNKEGKTIQVFVTSGERPIPVRHSLQVSYSDADKMVSRALTILAELRRPYEI